MKAISVKQPWASKIAAGIKTIETRTWGTRFRGPLLICASKSPKLKGHPTGVALCVVHLVGCETMRQRHEEAACCKIYPKAMAWILDNVKKFKKPIPIRGQLGLFDVDMTKLREGP